MVIEYTQPIRGRILIAIPLALMFLASACGKAPTATCPAAPTVASECTSTFQYGTSCQTQPEYSLQGDQANVDRYNALCAHLLDGRTPL